MTTTTTGPPTASTTPTGRPGDLAALTGIDTAARTLRLPTIRARVPT